MFKYSVSVEVAVIAETYHLTQNYPNPFNPHTQIRYTLPVRSQVTLTLFDVLGRNIRTLVNEEQGSGSYAVYFDAKDLPNGIYLYRLNAGACRETKTMTLLR